MPFTSPNISGLLAVTCPLPAIPANRENNNRKATTILFSEALGIANFISN
jgi:hypothetical protein